MMNDEYTESKDVGKPPPRWVALAYTRLHVVMHHLTGGRNTLGKLGEVCFVTMIGAKSGRKRVIPLMYVPYDEGMLLVASQGGAPKNPLWYHNLVKHPDIEVERRGKRGQYRARLAEHMEKATLWPICDRHYAPYADYRKRTARDLPIFICEPR